MLYVNLDRLLGDKKPFPNIAVAIAPGDLLEDFNFAWCESLHGDFGESLRRESEGYRIERVNLRRWVCVALRRLPLITARSTLKASDDSAD